MKKVTKKKTASKKKFTTKAKKPKVSKKQAKRELEKSKKVAGEYAKNKEKTAYLMDEALKKAQKNKGLLAKVWDDLMTMIRLVKAWSVGKYKNVPWETILWALAAIIYFVNPFDLIPDFIPVIGQLDDAVVIGLAVASIRGDLDDFRGWEATLK